MCVLGFSGVIFTLETIECFLHSNEERRYIPPVSSRSLVCLDSLLSNHSIIHSPSSFSRKYGTHFEALFLATNSQCLFSWPSFRHFDWRSLLSWSAELAVPFGAVEANRILLGGVLFKAIGCLRMSFYQTLWWRFRRISPPLFPPCQIPNHSFNESNTFSL